MPDPMQTPAPQQPPAQPPATPTPQPPAPAPKQGGSKTVVYVLVTIVILALIAGVIAGAMVFMSKDYGKNDDSDVKDLETTLDELQDEIDELSDESISDAKEEDVTDDLPDVVTPDVEPGTVVDNYMNSVLGSISGSSIDYDLAKSYMSSTYVMQFDETGFIPTSLCIQDGPDQILVKGTGINGEYATVRITAQFGADPSFQDMWDFELVQEAGEWKINGVSCVTATDYQ